MITHSCTKNDELMNHIILNKLKNTASITIKSIDRQEVRTHYSNIDGYILTEHVRMRIIPYISHTSPLTSSYFLFMIKQNNYQ